EVSQLCSDFFFFQAEDGIRDRTVTGVQTCALPIFAAFLVKQLPPEPEQRQLLYQERCDQNPGYATEREPPCRTRIVPAAGDETRSEERRVGKECRSWVSAE